MNDRATQKMCEQWQDGVEAVEGGRPDPGEFYAWLAEHDRQEREKAWDEGWAAHKAFNERPRGEFKFVPNPYQKQEPNVVEPHDHQWTENV